MFSRRLYYSLSPNYVLLVDKHPVRALSSTIKDIGVPPSRTKPSGSEPTTPEDFAPSSDNYLTKHGTLKEKDDPPPEIIGQGSGGPKNTTKNPVAFEERAWDISNPDSKDNDCSSESKLSRKKDAKVDKFAGQSDSERRDEKPKNRAASAMDEDMTPEAYDRRQSYGFRHTDDTASPNK